MQAAAQHIYTTITNNANIMALLTNGFHWELAPEKTNTPFATYRVEEAPFSKDGANTYTVNFYVWTTKLLAAANIADTIKTEIKNSDVKWRWVSASSGYTNFEAKEAFIELIFTFKL